MTVLRSLLPCLLIWQCGACILMAHQDPRGDTHPQIAVAKGQFQIFFHSNSSALMNSGWMRVIYAQDGKLISPRHPVKADLVQRALGTEPIYRRYPKPEDARIEKVLPRNNGSNRISAPARLVLQQKVDGVMKDVPLPMDAAKVADQTATYIDAKNAVLLWNSMDDINRGRFSLHLTWFRRGRFAAPTTCDLGPCSTIYDFSVASNLVIAVGRIWVAWIRPVDDSPEGPKKPYEAMLGSLDPATGKFESRKLPGLAHWNAHMCLAQTDGWLCAAWHSSKTAEYPGEAVIVTAFEKLPERQAK